MCNFANNTPKTFLQLYEIINNSAHRWSRPCHPQGGKMTIMVDTRAAVQDYMLQDDYVAVNDPLIAFSGVLDVSNNQFKLRYSDTDAVNATLSYELKLWKTTLA